MSFIKSFKQLIIVVTFDWRWWTRATGYKCSKAEICFFIIRRAWVWYFIVIRCQICFFGFSPFLIFEICSFFDFIVGAFCLDMTLFTTAISNVLVKIKITMFFKLYLFEAWLFFFKNLLNFLDNKLMVSSSLPLDSCCCLWLQALRVIPLMCFSSLSWITSLFISSSCSLSLPNNEAIVIDVKSFDSEMAVTFGCHVLLRQFNILMFSSSLSKDLPRLNKWFTMWENLSAHHKWSLPFAF